MILIKKIERAILNYNKTFDKVDIDPDIKTKELENVLRYIHDLVKIGIEAKVTDNKEPL